MGRLNFDLHRAIKEGYRTQADFAEALGVDEAKVSRVINGRRKITDEEKRIWARKLKKSVPEIFGRG